MDISNYLIGIDNTVSDAIKKMDISRNKIVFVVNDCQQLCGSFTDGDMRRYMMRSGKINDKINVAMNENPISFPVENQKGLDDFWANNPLVAVPIVDNERRIVKIRFFTEENSNWSRSIPDDVHVVIMAGGKGTRLYPYTKILPKPLIPIGNIPITEHIINRFNKYGLTKFSMIVNYKKNMIKAYFDDIARNYSLDFVQEEEFLGTGGGLSLLKGKIKSTCFVSNCDILLDLDYQCMYDYHIESHNKITMICAVKNMVVPYGIVELEEHGNIKSMTEKPEFSYLINTGVYLLEPDVIDNLIEGEYIHLPEIAQRYIDAGEKVGAYPITEKSWLDMGQLEAMEDMKKQLGLKDEK